MKTFLFASMILMLSACTNEKEVSLPLPLGSFTENDVEVSLHLDSNSNGDILLSATFTPLEGNHMYSKDIPITGVEGLGRPTLIELTADSQMKVTGALMESVPAEIPDFEPKTLLVYPPGAVTLSLPVQLPAGNDWVEDTVKVTYMSCSDTGCKPPVLGKVVEVRVPGADMAINEGNNE